MSHAPSPLRVLSGADLRALLPMVDAIALMAETLMALSAGRAANPLRSVSEIPGAPGRFGVMPGALAGAGFGAKLLSLYPGNPARGLSSHLGVVILFEEETGRPCALIDAAAVTAIRTAAVSGAATRLLAGPGAGDLAILGSGEQAASHLQAMAAVRPLRRVRVWSRTPGHAAAFAKAQAGHSPVPIETAPDVAAATAGADLICACTAAREPILTLAHVAPGAHVNAVGASTAATAEVDESLLVASRFIVDYRPSAQAEAGEYLQARARGAVDERHIVAELGQVAAGDVPGRTAPDQITLFKSLGVAVEDIAAARWLLDRAEAQNLGTVVDL